MRRSSYRCKEPKNHVVCISKYKQSSIPLNLSSYKHRYSKITEVDILKFYIFSRATIVSNKTHQRKITNKALTLESSIDSSDKFICN